MRDFFRKWWERLGFRAVIWVILFSAWLVFTAFSRGVDVFDPVFWILLVLGSLLLVNFLYLAWWLYLSPEASTPKPTPAQLREKRIRAVDDAVDNLPGAVSLPELCEKLDEKQTRKLLHHMNRIRPGSRHLRDTAHLWPLD